MGTVFYKNGNYDEKNPYNKEWIYNNFNTIPMNYKSYMIYERLEKDNIVFDIVKDNISLKTFYNVHDAIILINTLN